MRPEEPEEPDCTDTQVHGRKVVICLQRHRARLAHYLGRELLPITPTEAWDFDDLKDEISRACDRGFAWLEPRGSPFHVPVHGSYLTSLSTIQTEGFNSLSRILEASR